MFRSSIIKVRRRYPRQDTVAGGFSAENNDGRIQFTDAAAKHYDIATTSKRGGEGNVKEFTASIWSGSRGGSGHERWWERRVSR